MRFYVTGIKVDLNPKAVDQIMGDAAGRVLPAIGKVVVRDIKVSFTGQAGNPAKGEIYMKGKNRDIPHQASAAGQTPAVDTGRLKSSINFYYDKQGQRVIIGTTISDSEYGGYAPYLEFGTSRMAPRPFFLPAVRKYAGNNLLLERAKQYLAGLKPRGQ